MKHVIYTAIAVLLLWACNSSENKGTGTADTLTAQNSMNDSAMNVQMAAPAKEDTLEIKTIKTEIGWGYDIYKNGNLYVHQPHIPAVQGNKGFSTESDASRTANLVVFKIRNNIIPPSLSVKELDSLGVLKQ